MTDSCHHTALERKGKGAVTGHDHRQNVDKCQQMSTGNNRKCSTFHINCSMFSVHSHSPSRKKETENEDEKKYCTLGRSHVSPNGWMERMCTEWGGARQEMPSVSHCGSRSGNCCSCPMGRRGSNINYSIAKAFAECNWNIADNLARTSPFCASAYCSSTQEPARTVNVSLI